MKMCESGSILYTLPYSRGIHTHIHTHLLHTHAHISYKIIAVLDPLSLSSQRLSSILLSLRDHFTHTDTTRPAHTHTHNIHITLYLNPNPNLSDFPLKTFYRLPVHGLRFASEGKVKVRACVCGVRACVCENGT